MAIRASAENPERAALLGIPVTRVLLVVWMIAAVLSALRLDNGGGTNGRQCEHHEHSTHAH